MEDAYSQFQQRDAEVIAISKDSLDDARQMVQLLNIQFPVLSDPAANTIRLYGVYNLLGDGVATPSVFIIDKQGIIRWWYVGKNIADRPTTSVLLQQLDRVS